MLPTPRLAALAALLTLAVPARAAVIPVDSGTDDGAGCTLREAVEAATTDAAVGGCPAGDPGADVIAFAVPAVALTQGEVVVGTDVTLRGPVAVEAAPGARAFRVVGAGPVAFRDVSVRGGQGDGGAVRVEGPAALSLLGGTFEGNRAPGEGGAVWLGAAGSLDVRGTAFVANSARGLGGGALYTDGGPVALDGARFEGNRALAADGRGGAVLSPNGAALTAVGARFTLNRAQSGGGGALALGGGTATLTDVVLDQNQTEGPGGAVLAVGALSLTVTGGDVRDNRAAEGGGGLWTGPNVALSVEGTRLRRNQTTGPGANRGGGALYVGGGTASIAGAAFQDNRATGAQGAGGAVLVRGGAVTVGGGTTFTRNRAPALGGAVYLSAQGAVGPASIEATDVTFARNVAVSTEVGLGGAIYAVGEPGVAAATVDLTGGTFDTNVSERAAGAVAVEAGAVLTAEGTTFVDNRARWTHGAVLVDGSTAAFRDVLFERNRCRAVQRVGVGGALAVYTSDVTVEATTFRGNVAGRNGGAIYLGSTYYGGASALAVSGGTRFEDNTASTWNGDGGAIAAVDEASLRIEDAVFAGNRAYLGGAIRLPRVGEVAVARTTFRDNVATGSGGAIYRHTFEPGGDSMAVEASLFVANRADGAGGALYVKDGEPVTVRNSTFTANHAAVAGTVMSYRTPILLESVTVAGNTAADAYPGLVNNGGQPDPQDLRLRGTIVAGNTAPMGGDLQGPTGSLGHNVIGSTPDAGTFLPEPTDQLGADPRLEALADNGGPTLTMALGANSPAIGAGFPGAAVDQRGYARDGAPDAGAFELGAAPAILEAPPAGLEAPTAGLEVAPNPVAGRATVRARLGAPGRVRVAVYDVTGRRVRTLFDGPAGGAVEAPLDAAGLAAGVYVVVLEGGGVRASTRVSVVR